MLEERLRSDGEALLDFSEQTVPCHLAREFHSIPLHLCDSVRELTMNDCLFENGALRLITDSLPRLSGLASLSMRGVDASQVLLNAALLPSLRSLALQDASLTDSVVNSAFKLPSLHHQSYAASHSVSINTLRGHTLPPFPFAHLASLSLRFNMLTDMSAAAIAEWMQHPSTRLSSLDLGGNAIGCAGAQSIAGAMLSAAGGRGRGLRRLNLRANAISDVGLAAIARAVAAAAQRSAPVPLDLPSTLVEGGREGCDGSDASPPPDSAAALRDLFLGFNHYSEAAAAAALETIVRASGAAVTLRADATPPWRGSRLYLRRVDVQGFPFKTPKGVAAVAALLLTAPLLDTLALHIGPWLASRAPTAVESLRQLVDALERSPTLATLAMSGMSEGADGADDSGGAAAETAAAAAAAALTSPRRAAQRRQYHSHTARGVGHLGGREEAEGRDCAVGGSADRHTVSAAGRGGGRGSNSAHRGRDDDGEWRGAAAGRWGDVRASSTASAQAGGGGAYGGAAGGGGVGDGYDVRYVRRESSEGSGGWVRGGGRDDSQYGMARVGGRALTPPSAQPKAYEDIGGRGGGLTRGGVGQVRGEHVYSNAGLLHSDRGDYVAKRPSRSSSLAGVAAEVSDANACSHAALSQATDPKVLDDLIAHAVRKQLQALLDSGVVIPNPHSTNTLPLSMIQRSTSARSAERRGSDAPQDPPPSFRRGSPPFGSDPSAPSRAPPRLSGQREDPQDDGLYPHDQSDGRPRSLVAQRHRASDLPPPRTHHSLADSNERNVEHVQRNGRERTGDPSALAASGVQRWSVDTLGEAVARLELGLRSTNDRVLRVAAVTEVLAMELDDARDAVGALASASGMIPHDG